MSRRANLSRDAILDRAIPLFAESGYNGVSMRDIARSCGQSSASLYHHFPDKQALYLAAMKQAFADRTAQLLTLLREDGPADRRLRNLVETLCRQLTEDRTFQRLLQRELLDGDRQRLQLTAESVFSEVTRELQRLCRELAPQFDPFLLAGSIIGLVMQHFQNAGLRRFLPGYQPQHDNPVVIAEHIVALLPGGNQ
ncbi:TetR/AcrR family transcriptional regulator [Geothermobacter hydrogeniphilus]|uniref:HTH tetR-type domain-containing protein n=1 Tax=Geothermobacter hydrogeniphilus TaxID=1969733 RepID=A0A1X0Y0G1_9BACT|nr:TetR/AcrR family transcriptional regulator [Geothermobacter hydrogeniphilus]ORJ58578.1 hypothetical protein B5V00_12070 [Geothermobacter hydrogeniphilus]